MRTALMVATAAALLVSNGVWASGPDGVNIPAPGLVSMGVQQNATGFGNSPGGTQDSPGGSELDSLWGVISGGALHLGMAGNLEGNFNKLWIFIDSIPGGENTLDNMNTDGGFNEIQNLAGFTFDTGFAPDYAIRLEIGNGFDAIRLANLQANTNSTWVTGGGPGSLPIIRASAMDASGAVSGWNNANGLGVDGSSAAGALTATMGWEFDIPLSALGGGSGACVSAFITSGDGTFFSNQFLPSLPPGTGNLGGPPSSINLNQFPGDQFACAVPEPASLGLLALGLLAFVRRRS
ncbi:MAG TPA: PEP-CTERM sorting domain-containing protein [Phycisphaerae bacterium]